MVDDHSAKLILLAMIAIIGLIGGASFLTAHRTGKAAIRRPVGSAEHEVDRETTPREYRRVIAARGAMLVLLAVAFVAILAFY